MHNTRTSMEDGVGGDNISWRWRTGRTVRLGPSQRTYLAESSAETSAERSRQLVTLRKKKAKRSVHRRNQESKKRTRSSKVENTHWRVFTSQVLFFWFPLVLNQQRTISDTCSACPTHMRNAHRHTDTWRGTRHHTHAYS